MLRLAIAEAFPSIMILDVMGRVGQEEAVMHLLGPGREGLDISQMVNPFVVLTLVTNY